MARIYTTKEKRFKKIPTPKPTLMDLWLTAYGETVSIAAAARMLGISRCTVYRHKEQGHFIPAGGSRLLTRSIAAYVEAQGAERADNLTGRKLNGNI